MTGKGVQILVEAFLVVLHEVFAWLRNSKGSQPGKKQKDVPKS
jgi:hypothetical protein